MTDYHEPESELSEKVRSLTRALNSLKEEIEAVDWYHQRVDNEKDSSLKNILKHNMEEEIEHACMTSESSRNKNGSIDLIIWRNSNPCRLKKTKALNSTI